jgi:cell division protein FtsB
MKWLVLILTLMLIGLQYRLWISDGSLADMARLQQKIDTQQAENQRLQERNRILAAEVKALRNGSAAIEERARTDLGMIKKGETFYMVLEGLPSEQE